MKKFLLLLVLILLVGVAYLKVPTYSSGIKDDFFDTKHVAQDVSDGNNGVLLLTSYAEDLGKKIGLFELFVKEYGCLYAEDFEGVGTEGYNCKDYKSYISENDIGPREEKQYGKTMEDLLKDDIKLYMEVSKKDFFKYRSSLKGMISGLLYFEKAKIAYFHSLKGTKSFPLSVMLLQKSLENNLVVFTQSDGNILFFTLYKSIIQTDIDYLQFLLKNDLLDNQQKTRFYKILENYSLHENMYTDALRGEFSEKIHEFDKDFKQSLEQNYPSILEKTLLFFLLNKSETKEGYKKMYKDIIGGTHKESRALQLPYDIKNYIGKSFMVGAQLNYDDGKEDFRVFIDEVLAIQ